MDTPEDALKAADVILCLLFDKQAILDTLFSEKCKKLLIGRTFINMATVSPADSEEILSLCKKHKANFLEAPVLGTKLVAEKGQLQVFVGGDKDLFEKHREIFEPFSKYVVYVGEIPAASKLKICTNQILTSTVANFAQGIGMADRSGVSLDLLMDVLRNSMLHCGYYDFKFEPIRNRDFKDVQFDISGGAKDASFVADTCQNLGLDTRLPNAVRDIYHQAAEQFPHNDFAVVYNVINPLNTSSE